MADRRQPVRVAYLTGEYPRATDGWIQREIAALRDRGVVVDTFSVRRPGDEHMVGQEQRSERERTTYLFDQLRSAALVRAHLRLLRRSPSRYLRAAKLAMATSRPGLRNRLYQLAYLAEAGLLAAELRGRQIDHVHNHFGDSSCTVAMLAAELGGTTFSFTLHGPGIFFEPHTWRLDEKLARTAFCACISYFCRSQAAIFAGPDGLDKLHIVHCGVDPDVLTPVQHAGVGRRLLFVGRLAELKGVAVLLEALPKIIATHPTVRLTVVGDGPERARFESLAQRLGIADSVDFVGYQSQAEVADELSRTDVFVLPSYAEGVPVTLMEAMAAGVPVIATQVGGVSELVDNERNGFIVRPGDPEELASRLDQLLSDSELRQRLSAAGRAQVEAEFSNTIEAGRLETLFANTRDGLATDLRPGLPETGASER